MSHVEQLLKKLVHLRSQKMNQGNRITLVLLAMIILLFMVGAAYVVWFQWQNKPVADFLPADKTMGFVEFENFSLPARMSAAGYNPALLEGALKKILDIDYSKGLPDFAQGRLGVAVLAEDNRDPEPVLFFHTNGKGSALQFLQTLRLPGEEFTQTGSPDSPVYGFGQGQAFHFTFLGPYLFFARSVEALQALQSPSVGETMLAKDPGYLKAFSSLPRMPWGRGYLNLQRLTLSAENPLKPVLEPLKVFAGQLSFTVRQNQSGFQFNTFMTLPPEMMAFEKSVTDKTPFAYALTGQIPSSRLGAYFGGDNLSDEWISTLETLSKVNPAYGVLLEGLVQAQVSKLFGGPISLRNDFYPLFEGEYAFTLGLDDQGQLNVGLILAHHDRVFAEAKLKKLSQGFRLMASQFVPKIHTVTLPDGTESRELVPDDSQINERTETVNGHEVSCIEVGTSAYGFCWTATDDRMILGNHFSGMKAALEQKSGASLADFQPFRESLSNLSKVSDEISFFSIENWLPLVQGNPYGALVAPMLAPFEAVTWVKHNFDDGVSTEGVVLLK